jgi:hypothetical protein
VSLLSKVAGVPSFGFVLEVESGTVSCDAGNVACVCSTPELVPAAKISPLTTADDRAKPLALSPREKSERKKNKNKK